MQHCMSRILPICDQFFNPEFCNQLAGKTGFVSRSSSLIKGHEFIKSLVIPSDGLSEDSLNGICLRMREFNPKANISASALSQRINTVEAVNLMKSCAQYMLSITRGKLVKHFPCLDGILKAFNDVYIQDSTVIELNKHMAKYFKGTKRGGKKGGSTCKAQVKIDLIHNFTTGLLEEAKIHHGKLPDQALSNSILKKVKKGDLIITDLGYFKLDKFVSINKKEAFFISRFPSHVKVYLDHEDEQAVDLSEYLMKHYPRTSVIDIQVWIGAERLPMRLVAYRVPKAIENERRRKTKKAAKEMGRTTSKAKLDLLKFSLFITNAPEELIPATNIGTIYRIRWEIELIFKQMKSLLKIHVLKGTSPHRIKVLIWARICGVLILNIISSIYVNLAWDNFGVELSPTKLIQYLLRGNRLGNAIKQGKLAVLVKEMNRDLKRRLLKDKRNRSTMREKINNLEAYYEWSVYPEVINF